MGCLLDGEDFWCGGASIGGDGEDFWCGASVGDNGEGFDDPSVSAVDGEGFWCGASIGAW